MLLATWKIDIGGLKAPQWGRWSQSLGEATRLLKGWVFFHAKYDMYFLKLKLPLSINETFVKFHRGPKT